MVLRALVPGPNTMWDDKRKYIWLATALVVVTLVVLPQAYDEFGNFDADYFLLLEIIFLAVVVLMFFIYAKKSDNK